MQSSTEAGAAGVPHQNGAVHQNGTNIRSGPQDQQNGGDIDPDCPHQISGPIVKVNAYDGPPVFFSFDAAQCSVLIKNLLDDAYGGATNADDTPIPLDRISRPVLSKIRNWCEYHKNDAPNATDDEDHSRRSTDIERWDQEFMQVDQQMLFDIILAANYLDIKLLLDIGCKAVANMIKGKSPDEIRKTFNIQNDFTPEEEEQIHRENEWAEDR